MTMFSQTELDRLMKHTLPSDASAGTKVIVGTVDSEGVKVIASFKRLPKLDDPHQLTWELQAAGYHNWDGDDGAAGKILLQWQ
jgi:hypothetical protein